MARPRANPGRIAQGIGLVAGLVALAGGSVAAGLELERRIVSRRLRLRDEDDNEDFFSLRSSGPKVTTPDGVVLHTEVDELPDGVSDHDNLTVVLVHGYALSLDCWHFQRQYLRGRVRVVLYDQRSHGRSGRSAPENCRIGQLADDLAQVVDEVVGDGPCVLIGHSMGGMTIMRLARKHPEWFDTRVVGVGLISTSGGDMADYSPIRGLPGRTFARIAEPLMATLNRLPELVERSRKAGSDLSFVVTRRMSFGSDVPASYVEFMSEMLGSTPLEVVADYYPAFAELDEQEAFPVLARVECAVIGGEDDVITPIGHTDRIIELLPGAESVKVPNCGHMGMIEHHRQFNEVLAALIARARTHLRRNAG
ncbi:alpha/beta hydrolase [Microlunatus panaciterrae]|uniref:Pimeloyl-ACP methyl ester carboxylesterase n=1 Tax=Microlunatus panaciterrae TaxID=400768 RepID=A0ABS2RNW1_9ACTN|nr:alpha/beta hydrolase [Microlunatus panaciterrae]MBM7799624.1 pimeloyl-ACP methyl ester carboxylesterase [Microlunatus panaciterrae]